MLNKPTAIIPQDLVLIHIENKPNVFARVEDINPDMRRGWWQVKFLILALPLKIVTWIIDDDQIRGDDFTMDGVPIRIEKIISPEPERPRSEPDEDSHANESDTESQKQARILSFNRNKD